MDVRYLAVVLLLSGCATLKEDSHIEIRCSECQGLEIILDKDHTTTEPIPLPIPIP